MARYRKTSSRRGWKFTEKDFEVAKQLLGMNLGAQQVANVTGWGKATISRAASTDTFVDYLALTRSYTESIRIKQQAAKEAKATKTPERVDLPVSEDIGAIADEEIVPEDLENAILRIASALERMADAWENVPKKKGIFS